MAFALLKERRKPSVCQALFEACGVLGGPCVIFPRILVQKKKKSNTQPHKSSKLLKVAGDQKECPWGCWLVAAGCSGLVLLSHGEIWGLQEPLPDAAAAEM